MIVTAIRQVFLPSHVRGGSRVWQPIDTNKLSGAAAEHLPHLVLREQRADKLGIEAVSAAKCRDMPLQIAAGKRQITDQIQQFVPHAFIGKAETVFDRPVFTEDEQIVQGRRSSESLCFQRGGFSFEQKRACRRKLIAKHSGSERDLKHLPPDGGIFSIIEEIAQAQAGAGRRTRLDPTLLIAESGHLVDLEGGACSVLRFDSRPGESRDILRARAIESREFTAIEPDFTIVDLQSVQRGQGVLDHFHAHGGLLQNGAAGDFHTVDHARRNADRRAEITTHKRDAGPGRRRAKFHPDSFATPVTAASHRGWPRESSLLTCRVNQCRDPKLKR